MNRLKPLIMGIGAALVAGLALSGSPILLVLVVPIGAVAVAVGRLGRSRPMSEDRWSVTTAGASSGGAAIGVLTAPETGEKVLARPADTVRALGRLEGGQLVLSPWFGAGLGFFFMMLLTTVVLWGHENTDSWPETIQILPWTVHPFVGMVVVASHRAVTRAERDGTAEVFDTCPTPLETRTAGFLASAWVGVIAVGVYAVVVLVGTHLRSALVHGSIDGDAVADLLGVLWLPIGGVALGVALGRWVRFGLAPIVAVVAVGFATSGLNGVGGHDWNPLTLLATAPTVEGSSPIFADRPAWFHLLWIIGLTAVVAVVAVWRDRRDRSVLAVGVLGAALVVVAGFGATAAMSSGSAEDIALRISNPETDQVCRPATAQVQVCMFEYHAELLAPYVERITRVALALPPGSGPITMRQVYNEDLAQLPPEVRRRLTPDDLQRPPGEVRLPNLDDLFFSPDGPAAALAFGAVGLPSVPDEHLLPTVVAGEARGVVALWLATRGLPDDDMQRAAVSEDPFSPDAFERGTLGGTGECSTPSVVWSAQDLEAARSLIALPEARVVEVLSDDWDRWIEPSTSTDDLLEALGLAPIGPFDDVEPRPGNPC